MKIDEKPFPFTWIGRGATLLALTGLLVSCSQSQPGTSKKPASQTSLVVEEMPQSWYDMDATEIPLDVTDGASPEIARNFYFVLDGSGSMTQAPSSDCGGSQRFATKMEGAVWALERFLEHVPEDVKIGLYVFDSAGSREALPIGRDNREAFREAVRGVNPGQQTPLAKAIRFGSNRLVAEYKKQLGYGEFRLVVITDGEAAKIPEASHYAARFGIPIYAIGLCVGERHPLRQFSVSYRAADNFEDLARGLQDTLAELPNFDVAEFADAP